MSGAEADRAAQLVRLAEGYQATQLLYVAVRLGVPEALADRPRTSAELAGALGADAGVLHRVLRGLAAEGVLDERPGGGFALTELGQLLRPDVPASQRGAVLARGSLYYRSLAGLLDAARDGRVPFEIVHGSTFFDYLAERPEEGAAFQASMGARSAREAAALVAAYDFGRFRRLVDVGGGPGVLLTAILDATPDLSGLLFDRPEVAARSALPAIGGDFFAEVPPGSDAYLLSRVLHDWPDEDAVRILRTCRAAMPEHGTLLAVEAVIPERAADLPAAVRMDLHMLTLLAGRERTISEFRALFEAAGLGLSRVVLVDAPAGLHLLEAGPA